MSGQPSAEKLGLVRPDNNPFKTRGFISTTLSPSNPLTRFMVVRWRSALLLLAVSFLVVLDEWVSPPSCRAVQGGGNAREHLTNEEAEGDVCRKITLARVGFWLPGRVFLRFLHGQVLQSKFHLLASVGIRFALSDNKTCTIWNSSSEESLQFSVLIEARLVEKELARPVSCTH